MGWCLLTNLNKADAGEIKCFEPQSIPNSFFCVIGHALERGFDGHRRLVVPEVHIQCRRSYCSCHYIFDTTSVIWPYSPDVRYRYK